eukprot:5093525-Prymnesium_polylepis.1
MALFCRDAATARQDSGPLKWNGPECVYAGEQHRTAKSVRQPIWVRVTRAALRTCFLSALHIRRGSVTPRRGCAAGWS